MAAVMTGAKAVLKINGEILAFASGVNVNQEDTVTEVDVLGMIETADLAETGHRASCTVNYFKVVNPALAQRAVDIGIEEAVLADMRDRDYFDIEILDNNNQSIYKLEACKWEGGSGQLDARGLWTGSWNFRARRGRGL